MKTKSILTKVFTTVASVLMLAAVSGGNAYAADIVPGYDLGPDISPAGYPHFENQVKIKVIQRGQKGFNLKGWKNGKENYFNVSPLEGTKITGGYYKLDAMFDTVGDFIEGTLKIKGRMDTPLGEARGTLMTATLTDFAFTSDLDSSLLGFNTTDIECNSIIDEWVGCTTNESVYIALDEGGFSPTVKNFKSDGLSVATVPVPTAVWLFGSGLLALVGVARRRTH